MRSLLRLVARYRVPVLLVMGLVGAAVVGRRRAASAVPAASVVPAASPSSPPPPIPAPAPARPAAPAPGPLPAAASAPPLTAVPAPPPAAAPPPATASSQETLFIAGAEPGRYPGSVLALKDGSAPSDEYTVKAKDATKRCHGPQSPYFRRTRADLWFRTETDAVAAGFTPWQPAKD